MIRSLVDFSRRSCARMAGGCPGYGSGGVTTRSRSVATTSQATQQLPRPQVRPKGEEEKAFRDELYKYWETSFT
ncbi:hypothetical protein ACHAXT_006008 [Thalassiosira profunda]